MNNNDEFDMLFTQAFLDEAKKEKYDLNNSDLVIIDVKNQKIYTENAEKVDERVNKYFEIKNKIFDNINLDTISPEEYEKAIQKFINIINGTERNIINLKEKYSYIDFDNLDERIPNLIVSGELLYNSIYDNFGPDNDYSPVMLQWCRAVELELRNKIFAFLKPYNVKKAIIEESKNSEYYKQNKNTPIRVNNMMGFYEALEKYGLTEYVFNNFIKDEYKNFTYNIFKEIIDYVKTVNVYRDNSAHSESDIEMNQNTADVCKDYILSSQKLLEILSNLELIGE